MQDTEEGRIEYATNDKISWKTIKKSCFPLWVGFAIGILLVLLNLSLPKVIVTSFTYVGAMTTPLFQIFIGIEMSRIAFSDIKFDKDMFWSIFGRIVSALYVH